MKFPDIKPIVVASHPRSGTHLLIDVLRRHFRECRSWKWWGERMDRLYCNIDELNAEQGLLDTKTALRILSRTPRPLVKSHGWPGFRRGFFSTHHDDGLDPAWAAWLNERATFLYIYRDGRDVLCSYQRFRQQFDASANGDSGRFIRGSDGEEVDRVSRWTNHVRAWLEEPNVHAVRFENLLKDPSGVIERLGRILNAPPAMTQPLLPKPFRSIWHSRLARVAQMRPESTAIIGPSSANWEEAFARKDREYFHERAGDLLTELGYETSNAWIDEAEPSAVS